MISGLTKNDYRYNKNCNVNRNCNRNKHKFTDMVLTYARADQNICLHLDCVWYHMIWNEMWVLIKVHAQILTQWCCPSLQQWSSIQLAPKQQLSGIDTCTYRQCLNAPRHGWNYLPNLASSGVGAPVLLPEGCKAVTDPMFPLFISKLYIQQPPPTLAPTTLYSRSRVQLAEATWLLCV